jgi:hypothetical protein
MGRASCEDVRTMLGGVLMFVRRFKELGRYLSRRYGKQITVITSHFGSLHLSSHHYEYGEVGVIGQHRTRATVLCTRAP